MTESDFLNLGKNTAEETKGDSTPIESPPSNPKEIIERTLHTIHTIMVYPNGQIFLKKPISWLDKKGTIVKTKEKKKPVKLEQSHLGKEEVY